MKGAPSLILLGLLAVSFVPSTTGTSTSWTTASAPLEACGDFEVRGHGLTLFQYSADAGGLVASVHRGRVEIVHQLPSGIAMPPEIIVLEDDEVRVGRASHASVSFPSDRFVFEPATPTSECVPVLVGPNPARVFGEPEPRTVDPWHVFPGVPEDRFLLVPRDSFRIAGATDVLIEQGVLEFVSTGRDPEWAGVRYLEEPPIVAPVGDDRLYTERRFIRLHVDDGELRVRQGSVERPMAFWREGTPLRDSHELLPGMYFPRPLAPWFEDFQQEWALPDAVVSGHEVSLHRGASWRVDWQGKAQMSPLVSVEATGASADQRHLTFEYETEASRSHPRAVSGATEFADLGLVAALSLVLSLWGGRRKVGFLLFWVALPVRITRPLVEGHAVRAKILELLRSQPGLGKKEISERLDLGWGTTLYHLDVLERYGFLRTVHVGRHARMVLAEPDAVAARRAAYRRNGIIRAIEAFIEGVPGCTQGELARHLRVTQATVWWHIGRLERAGLVLRRRGGRTVHYYSTLSALAPSGAAPAASQPLASALS